MAGCINSTCSKRRACKILGECVFKHEFFINNPSGQRDLRGVSNLEEVVKVFNKHTTRRVVIGSYRGKGKFIYPNQYNYGGKIERKIERKNQRNIVKSKLHRGEISEVPNIVNRLALDPVTIRLYKARMKRVAELDAQFGYIYDETTRGNFHE